MVDIRLNNEGKNLLKDLIGKKLIKYRHDPLDKFGGEMIYERVELFFDDSTILVEYDYTPYPIFGSKDDEHPVFSIKRISSEDAVSALKDVSQINVRYDKTITGITLIEDHVEIEWNGKKDDIKFHKALIFEFGKEEIALQGDYMMPLLKIIKGENSISKLLEPGDEFKDDPEVQYSAQRFLIKL